MARKAKQKICPENPSLKPLQSAVGHASIIARNAREIAVKTILIALYVPALLVALSGCSAPPIKDNLTLVPVSDKADMESGLSLTYIYGTNQGFFDQAACNRERACWYSGNLMTTGNGNGRMNSIVVKSSADGQIAWARSYQINDVYTAALGLLPTSHGSTLLYGNSIVSHSTNNYGEPVYELLNPQGLPQWGGALLIGDIQNWSAFTDALNLKSGGYALTGSSKIYGRYWSGTLIKLNASGKVVWADLIRSQKRDTLTLYLAQMKNQNIMLLGYNAVMEDLVLFELDPNGKLLKAPIVRIRGSQVPVGLIHLKNGLAAVARDTMPSGESAAVVILLDEKGNIKRIVRYRFTDGFNPYDVIAMPGHAMCIYGNTEAEDKPQSLAFTLNEKLEPVSALAMKDKDVFASGALLTPDQLVFSGARPLGLHKHLTSLIVKWTPSVMNQTAVLGKIQLSPIKINVDEDAQAGTVNAMGLFKINFFPGENLKSGIIYKGTSPTATP